MSPLTDLWPSGHPAVGRDSPVAVPFLFLKQGLAIFLSFELPELPYNVHGGAAVALWAQCVRYACHV